MTLSQTLSAAANPQGDPQVANALMIDLETLATTPRAAVLQAGWCVFELNAGLTSAATVTGNQVNVDLDSCRRAGGEFSDSTIRWWLNRPKETQASVAAPGIPISNALTLLFDAYAQGRCSTVWAHGSVFDLPIVEHYARACGLPVPWRFWNVRDTRTLFAAAEATEWSRPMAETAHTALADAVSQARDVQSAWAWVTVRAGAVKIIP